MNAMIAYHMTTSIPQMFTTVFLIQIVTLGLNLMECETFYTVPVDVYAGNQSWSGSAATEEGGGDLALCDVDRHGSVFKPMLAIFGLGMFIPTAVLSPFQVSFWETVNTELWV